MMSKNQIKVYEDKKNRLIELKSEHFRNQNELDKLRGIYLNK